MVAKRRGKPIEEIGENEFHAIVVHGEQIDTLTDSEWDNIFWKDEIIFARTSPKHKLEIVRRAQRYAALFLVHDGHSLTLKQYGTHCRRYWGRRERLSGP